MSTFIYIFSSMCAVAAAVLAVIFILPESKRAKLNPFGKFLHDFLNFKECWLPLIFKFMYVTATVFSVVYGALSVFSFRTYETYVPGAFEAGKYVPGYYETNLEWQGWKGFLILILAPIAIRIAYEFLLLALNAIKSIIDINKKLGNPLSIKLAEDNAEDVANDIVEPVENVEPKAPVAEAPAPAADPKPVFCIHCGQRLDSNGNCLNPVCPEK